MQRHDDNDNETILTPEEEAALMNAPLDNNNSNHNAAAASPSSSASSSTWTTSSDDDDDDDSTSSSGNSSSSSSSSSSSASPCPTKHPEFYYQFVCDSTEKTRTLFSNNNAWLFPKETPAISVERVSLWSFDAATSSWQCHQPYHVAMSTQPFALGAMRAGFLLSDCTRQVDFATVQERARQATVAASAAKATNSLVNGGVDTGVAASLRLLQQQQQHLQQRCYSFDPAAAPALVAMGREPRSATTADATTTATAAAAPAIAQELYVAKSYRRFLARRKPSTDERREEIARLFRDAHMTSVAQKWADAFNAKKPPCPRISFLPNWVLQRSQSLPSGAAGFGPSEHAVENNNNNNNSSNNSTDQNNSDSTQQRVLLRNTATSRPCDYFAVEPILTGGAFVKHNNNSGFVRCSNLAAASAASLMMSNNRAALDDECRQAAQAFTHFTYQLSGKTLMCCDIQGVGSVWTDVQIHTNDGQGFGRGNLGCKGLYRCVKAHKCNRICAALGLTRMDVEQERVALKMQERKVRSGALRGVQQVELPSALLGRIAEQMDFDF